MSPMLEWILCHRSGIAHAFENNHHRALCGVSSFDDSVWTLAAEKNKRCARCTQLTNQRITKDLQPK